MWGNYQLILLIMSVTIIILSSVRTLVQFAVFSEMVWLSLYLLSALVGSLVDDLSIYSSPFLILVITATEAVVVWTLITYQSQIKV